MDYDSLKQEIFRLYFDVGLNQVKVTDEVAHLMGEGSIRRIRQDWFPYYQVIKDDWQNWR